MPVPMLAVRCSGTTAAAAYPTAQRIRAARSGARRAAVLSAATGTRELTLRVPFSPCSQLRCVGASCPWPVVSALGIARSPADVLLGCVNPNPLPLPRCSPGDPPHAEESCVRNKERNEAWEALKAAIADTFRPLMRNLGEILSLRTAYDLEDYQIGMLAGAFLGCVGCYQLWKTAPSAFVDFTLAYLIYKLSVLSSALHRQRKPNSLITRLKFGAILIMVMKDIRKNYVLLDVVRMPLLFLYICSFIFEVAGMKKHARGTLIFLVNLLKTRGGIQEICRIMWCPGYVSPYDDPGF